MILCLCSLCIELAKKAINLKVVREWGHGPCDLCARIGCFFIEAKPEDRGKSSRPSAPKFMLGSKIPLLDNWEENVLVPTTRSSKQIEDPLVVAFDMEDYGIDDEVKKKDGGKIRYSKRFLLGTTFATLDKDGKSITSIMNDENCKLTIKQIENHIRQWLNLPPDRVIYLVSHWDTAEFRHIADWRNLVKKKKARVIIVHDKTIHFQTKSLVVIDSFAFFNKGLPSVAKFVGMEKVEMNVQGKNHQYCIEHMDWVKKEDSEQFWRYAIHDSVVLVQAFTKLRRLFWDRFQVELLNIGMHPTIASIAVYLLRRDYLKSNAAKWIKRMERVERKLKSGKYSPHVVSRTVFDQSDIDIRLSALYNYKGARREAAGCGFFRYPVTMLDVVGSYNKSGIDCPLPNEHTKWVRREGKEHIDEILKGVGWVRITNYRHDPNCLYPIVPEQPDYALRLMWALSGPEAYFTTFELRTGMKYFGLKFDTIKAWFFIPTENEINHDLRKFLLVFRVLKDQAKKAGDKLLEHIAKLISNSLIGKFMQAIEDDEEFLNEFFGLMKFDTREQRLQRRGRPQPAHKQLPSFFAPEWSTLILGHARAILGLGAAITKAITYHTDSLVFPSDSQKEKEVCEVLRNEFGTEMEKKFDADGFWILRSAVYIALKKGKDGKWEALTNKDDEVWVAHHAISTDNLEKTFVQPVLDVINGGEWSNPRLKKSSLASAKTEKERGIPMGCDYDREGEIKLKWDYKRILPEGFDITKDVFRSFQLCEPYGNVWMAYVEEDKKIREERGIKVGRQPRSHEPHRPKIYPNSAARQRAYRQRVKKKRELQSSRTNTA